MSLATCTTCGDSFDQDEPWKKICTPCWQEKKRAEKAAASGIDNELFCLRVEVAALRQQIERQGIEPAMLKKLIRLCHPDRHGNSQASNQATSWLLVQRG
jgi:hypothetical protein